MFTPDPKPTHTKKEKPLCRVMGCTILAKEDKNGYCSGHYDQIHKQKKRTPIKTKSKPKQRSTSKHAYWRRKARQIFQKYCRLRDADKDGIAWCMTCGKPVVWNGGDCNGGHLRPATFGNTCFDERNCGSQCISCNMNGMQAKETIEIYEKRVDEKWGPGTAEELFLKSMIEKKLNTIDYIGYYAHYSSKFQELVEGRKSKGWVV